MPCRLRSERRAPPSGDFAGLYPCCCELRDFFAKRLLLIRDELDLMRMEFALDLGIDRYSCHDLENRKFLCCALTLLVYLCFFCADPLAVLRECKNIIKKAPCCQALTFSLVNAA